MFPFFLNMADQDTFYKAKPLVQKEFLQSGGVVTTLKRTSEQWDAPNGWACLHWVTITGLENYGEKILSREIAERWVNLNKKVFYATGKLVEKYDVMDADKPGGGGEYPTQDGFGWTNGVLLALIKKYHLEESH
jgi:alpha,alpha-trehalase